MDYTRLVAANIRRQRRGFGLTQEEVARGADISPQHMSKIERCACSPTVDTVSRIAACMGVSPASFFETTDIDAVIYLYTDIDSSTNGRFKA